MIEKVSNSVLSELERIGADFVSGERNQFKAYEELYRIYVKAGRDVETATEIDEAFNAAEITGKPKRCKQLAGKIGWLTFSSSKQRVSDLVKVLRGAEVCQVRSDHLATWIEEQGGIKGAIRFFGQRTTRSANSLEPKKNPDFAKFVRRLQQLASNRRTSDGPSCGAKPPLGSCVVEIHELQGDGTFVTLTAIISDVSTTFPKLAELRRQEQTTAEIETYDTLLAKARIVEPITETLAA